MCQGSRFSSRAAEKFFFSTQVNLGFLSRNKCETGSRGSRRSSLSRRPLFCGSGSGSVTRRATGPPPPVELLLSSEAKRGASARPVSSAAGPKPAARRRTRADRRGRALRSRSRRSPSRLREPPSDAPPVTCDATEQRFRSRSSSCRGLKNSHRSRRKDAPELRGVLTGVRSSNSWPSRNGVNQHESGRFKS
ncbi:hypothetical protein GN956_G19590 [Arapaima gigas]